MGKAKTGAKRTNYLHVRNGVYYFRRSIPAKYQHLFPDYPAGQIWKSLETSNLAEAKAALAAKVYEYECRLNPPATHLPVISDVKPVAGLHFNQLSTTEIEFLISVWARKAKEEENRLAQENLKRSTEFLRHEFGEEIPEGAIDFEREENLRNIADDIIYGQRDIKERSYNVGRQAACGY